jgi:hypothetical protein
LIIVISGFNITIIAGLLATIFGRLLGHGRKGARWGALFALIGIVIYTTWWDVKRRWCGLACQ